MHRLISQNTITVPANKNIAIFGATNATTVVGRGSVAGDMFKVSAGSILSMTQNEGDGSTEIGKLLLKVIKTMELQPMDRSFSRSWR